MSYCFDPDCQQPKNTVQENFCLSCNAPHGNILTTIQETTIDCSQLQNYLKAQNWKQANQETERLLLQAA